MSAEIKHRIKDFLNESTHFNLNDVLIHLEKDNRKLLFSDDLIFDLDNFPSLIIRETKKTLKESGVNTLSRSTGVLMFQYEGRDIHTPIFLHSLEVKNDRIKRKVHFSLQEEDWFVNPFLINYLSHSLEEELPNFNEQKDFYLFLKEKGLSNIITDQHIIGNFHHHRFQIIKELEDLQNCSDLNPNVKVLLGENEKVRIAPTNWSKIRLLPSDVDHEKVFSKLEKNNCVVQGPPGTGKSQVLTNVLANNLLNDATTIVVSEKRVALEVLVKKMKEFHLDKLCFIATSDKLSHSFLQELKSTWDYFDAFDSSKEVNLGLSKQYEDRLQMSLNLLQQKELIGGVSFTKFKEISVRSSGWENSAFSSHIPSISTVLDEEAVISTIYAQDVHQIIGLIRPEILNDNLFSSLDLKAKRWLNVLQKINQKIPFSSFEELRRLMRIAVDCQVYENEFFKKYFPIFKHNSRHQKRFLSLRKKYLKSKIEVENIRQNQSHWKVIPSEIETEQLLKTIREGGFFTKRKAQKRWKEIATVSFKGAEEILNLHALDLVKVNKLHKISIDFCEIGVDNPETDVESIYQTYVQFTSEQWVELEKIPLTERQNLTSFHQELNFLFSEFRTYFDFDEQTNVLSFMESFLQSFEKILTIKSELEVTENSFFTLLKEAESADDYFKIVLKSHWVKFKGHFPAFSDFEMGSFRNKIEDVIKLENKEGFSMAKEIEFDLKQRFDKYHLLLQTPARKLSDVDKKNKAILRKGKAILIKEFSKTRSHPSLRELFASEARVWIQLLKPIWLSNPMQLAKCFPFEKNIFDLAIFDEASQIPVQNALGTIQRSKQVLIAGDEHQMGPTSYFKKGEEEIIDLLHQANYHFEKVTLHHHYRSVQTDLIAFSNKHFYNNSLMVFPSKSDSIPIHHHFVEKGRFIDRKNEIEAKEIALGIENQIDSTGVFGVVAFSEEQLSCIWDALTEDTQRKFSDKIERNYAFFKSLENVQGDECDHLFISFGYGKNEDDNFYLRFGPVNKLNGRKRLNVLLTRAKKTIHFYCSVRSSEFKLTDNESVNLLKKWIAFSEKYDKKSELHFPFGLEPIIKGSTLELKNIHKKINSAKELVNLHRVLKARGWNVIYS